MRPAASRTTSKRWRDSSHRVFLDAPIVIMFSHARANPVFHVEAVLPARSCRGVVCTVAPAVKQRIHRALGDVIRGRDAGLPAGYFAVFLANNGPALFSGLFRPHIHR